MVEGHGAGPGIELNRFDEFLCRAAEAQAIAMSLSDRPVRRRFSILGSNIELSLASEPLAEILCPALAHIETAFHGEPDFSFCIWDSLSSGIEAPPPCWGRNELFGHGEITALIDNERYLQVADDRCIVAAHRSWRKAAVWLRSIDDVGEWERSAPLLTLFNWWASGLGYFNVHAASVGYQDGGLLIVGPGGVGKSHTAIACLGSDLLYVSDDHCLLKAGQNPSTASVYCTAKLFEKDLGRFPILEDRKSEAFRTSEGKRVFFLKNILPDQITRGFPLRAVITPHYSGQRDTKIVPTSAAKALLSLGPDNVLRWPSVGRTAFAAFAEAFRTLPCFRLETGSDTSQIPHTLSRLLDDLRAQRFPSSAT